MERFSALSLIRHSLGGRQSLQPQRRFPEPKPEYDAVIIGAGRRAGPPDGSRAPRVYGERRRYTAGWALAEAHEAAIAAALASIEPDGGTGSNAMPPDGPSFGGVDGGYLRGRDQDWFEVIAGQSAVSFHRDGRAPDPSGLCFTFAQPTDGKARARLADTLRRQGVQPQQQVIFLSVRSMTSKVWPTKSLQILKRNPRWGHSESSPRQSANSQRICTTMAATS